MLHDLRLFYAIFVGVEGGAEIYIVLKIFSWRLGSIPYSAFWLFDRCRNSYAVSAAERGPLSFALLLTSIK